MPPPKTVTRAKSGIPIPGHFQDRQLEELAQSSTKALISLDERVTTLELAQELYELQSVRIMPTDDYTSLWWPLNEVNQPAFHNEGLDHQPQEMLVPLATCAPTYGGLLWDTCARLYGADATRHAAGAAGMTGGGTLAASVSCWIKPGDAGTGSTRLAFGYFSSDFARATIFVGITGGGLPFVQVESAAGVRSCTAQNDSRITMGRWHHLAGTYSGTACAIYVDGAGTSATFANSPLLWTITPSPRWVLGTAQPQGFIGLIQDARFHTIARDSTWAHESWRRGMGLYP